MLYSTSQLSHSTKSEMSTLRYQYEPLKWGEIRLLKLCCRKCFCYICGIHVNDCYHCDHVHDVEQTKRCHPSHRTTDVEELTGELQIFKLNAAPKFVALSYVWGAKENGKYFTLRQPRRLLSLTSNCHEALTNLWKRGSRYI